MISNSTWCVNALHKFSASLFIFALFTNFTFASETAAREFKVELPKKEFSSNLVGDEAKSSTAEGRIIQFLQLSPTVAQFEFSKFSYFWLTSEDQYKTFWAKNSKISGDAPSLNVKWRSQNVLAIFWESKDSVVRNPTFMGSEESTDNGIKTLKLILGENSPCFGIITSSSPALFMIVDSNFADLDSIVLKTQPTKSVGCY